MEKLASLSFIKTKENTTLLFKMSEVVVSPQLKFLINNINRIIHTQLTSCSFPIWKSQVHKIFSANRFEDYLDKSTLKPLNQRINNKVKIIPDLQYNSWMLSYQNLVTVFYSTMSSALLSYVLNLDSCKDMWKAIENRH